MDMTPNRLVRYIDRIEDALLVIILSVMIILSVYQIFSRNFLSESYVWIDPLLRILVLWIGLTGAIVAARNNHHIRIDLFTRYFSMRVRAYVARIAYFVTMTVCLIIAWHGARFVIDEYEYQTIAFGDIPTWITGSIIPVSFMLIAIRYGMLFVSPQPATEKQNGTND